MSKSGIHIKPSKKGTFTAAAKKHGKGVQEFARQVMANKENYSPAMVKKANFAKNAAKWKHEQGGAVDSHYQELGGVHSMRPLPGHQIPVGKAFTPTPGHYYPMYERDMQPLPQKARYGADIEPFVYHGYSDNTPMGNGIKKNLKGKKSKYQSGGEMSQDQQAASIIGGVLQAKQDKVDDATQKLAQAAKFMMEYGGYVPMAQAGFGLPGIEGISNQYVTPEMAAAATANYTAAQNQAANPIATAAGITTNSNMGLSTNGLTHEVGHSGVFSAEKGILGMQKQNAKTTPATVNKTKTEEKKKKEIDYKKMGMNAVSIGLGLANIGIKDPTRHQYYTPEDTPYYNPYPMGTGSQAIYEQGGFVNSNAVDFPYRSGIRFREGGEIMNVASLSNPIARMGGNIRRNIMSEYEQGGELELYDARTGAQPISENPNAGPIVEFKGPSHEERNNVGSNGIPMAWNGNEVEVEGGETAFKDNQGNFQILGNMKNPLTGRKFKQDGKLIAKAERKADKTMQKGLDLINSSDPDNPYEMLRFNSGKAKMQGATQKFQEMEELRNNLANIQQQKLDLAASLGIEPMEMDKKAYFGKMMTAQAGKKIGLGTKFGDLEQPFYKGMDTAYVTAKVPKKGEKGKAAAPAAYAPPLPSSGIFGVPQWQSQDEVPMMEPVYVTAKRPNRQVPVLTGQPTYPNTSYPSWASSSNQPSAEMPQIVPANEVPMLDGPMYKSPARAASASQAPATQTVSTEDVPLMPPVYVTAKIPKKGANTTKTGTSATSSTTSAAKKAPATGKTRGAGERPNGAPPTPQGPDVTPRGFLVPSIRPDFEWPEDTPPTSVTTTEETTNPPVQGQTYDFGVPPRVDLTSDAEGFNIMNAYPEIYAMATNRYEPVLMQKYRPELLQPYQVSFQDQLDRNTDTFRTMAQASRWNPSAMGAFAAQKYQADQGVLGNQFRTNQEISANIANANRQIMNETQQRNLGLADQQYVRQAQARANTNQRTFDALQSLSTKKLQHQKAMNELKVMENLYNFRFDNDYRAQYEGPQARFDKRVVYGTDEQGRPQLQLMPTSTAKTTEKKKGKYGMNLAKEFKNYK